MFTEAGNRVHSNPQSPTASDAQHSCAVFIAHFSDGYRVIYRMNGEWLLDALEQTLTDARLKAERCIEAMLASGHCPHAIAEIYEITITAGMSETMKCGLRDPLSDWQYHMTHAAGILGDLGHIHTVSFITDSSQQGNGQKIIPYLFVVSSKAFGNQHHIDTIRLRKSRPSLKAGIIHEVSEGKAHWHSENVHQEHKVVSPVKRNGHKRSILHAITHRVQGIIHPRKTGYGY